VKIKEQTSWKHVSKRDWTTSSIIHRYSTLDSENNWEDLCIQLRNQQTCTSGNHNYIKGALMFSPVFVDVLYVKSTWILTWHRMDHFHGHLDYFLKPPLGSRPNTKPGYHGTPNIHNHRLILFYCVWKPTWIEIHWNSTRLIARSHVTSHCSWGSVTTLDDFGVLGQPLDTFFWALTVSSSWFLACVWSGPYSTVPFE
jgi:hypothetical protein